MATIIHVTKSGRKTPIFTLAKGDARTKRVQFVIPRDDAEVPLDELTWRIVIKNAVGEQDGTALQKEVHGDHIDLWWTCGYIAANAVGLTTIYLNAFNEDGKMQWSSGEYCIQVIPAKEDEQEEGNGLSELQELIESARQAMENATMATIEATQSAIEAAGSANEAANTAEKAAEAADNARLAIADELSKKAHTIYVDASGDMVHITDGAAMPVQGLITHVEPKQEGSGDPSPDNVRPIIGWNSVSVTNDTSSQTLTAELPETLYGFDKNWTTGLVTVKKEIYTFTGDEEITVLSPSGNRYFAYYGDTNKTGVHDSQAVCSHFKKGTVTSSTTTKNVFSIWRNGTTQSWRINFRLEDATITDAAACKAWLAEQYAAGTPVTVVYELAEPYTIQLTPQQMETLKGMNNIWSDAGATEVTYAADTKLYIDGKIAAIAAAIV